MEWNKDGQKCGLVQVKEGNVQWRAALTQKGEYAWQSVHWSELNTINPTACDTLFCILNCSGTHISSPNEIQAHDFVYE